MVYSLHKTLKVLLLASWIMMPATIMAQDTQHTQIEQEINAPTITASGTNLRIKNAEGLVLEVFSLTGEKVYTLRIESTSKSIDLSHLQRGYYIVKVGKHTTRKIYLH